VERLVAECLARARSEGDSAIEAVLEDHPEHAARVRQCLEGLERVGLIARAQASSFRGDGDLGRFGAFRLLRVIGSGGMGVVYLADQVPLGRRVAVKVIKSELLFSASARERFQREAQVVSQLDHPGICPLFEAGEVEGRPYIAMRYLEGDTLAERLGRARAAPAIAETPSPAPSSSTGPSSRGEIVEIVHLIEKAALAIHAAHERGLVHRDLKPGNIMVTAGEAPVILDFGLARFEESEGNTLTRTGMVMGTPAYMAPEQVSGNAALIDRRTDVYALGATLYECLTLRTPFSAATRDQLYQRILTGEPVSPRRLNPRLPRDLEVVLETSLDKAMGRRYQTAAAFAEDLRRWRNHEPIQARPTSRLVRLQRWALRRPAVAALLAVLIVGIPSMAAMAGYLVAGLDEMRIGAEQLLLDRVEAHLETGLNDLDQNSWNRAVAAFEEALALKPDSPVAVAGLALSYRDQAKKELAAAVLERYANVTRVHPCLADLRDDMLATGRRGAEAASARTDTGAPGSALACFLAGLRAKPRGMCHEPAAWKKAIDLFEAAVYRSTRSRAIYLLELARTAGRAGDLATERQAAAALVARWPGSAPAWESWGESLHRNGQYLEAVEARERALTFGPDRAVIHHNLGLSYAELGNHDRALQALRRSVEMEPANAPFRVNLGIFLHKRGDPEGAAAELRKAIELDPRNPQALSSLGTTLTRMGDIPAALKACERAVELEPDYADFQINLGEARAVKGDYPGAIAAFRKAAEIRPDYPDAHFNLGLAFDACGKLESAIAAYREAIRLNPDDAGVHGNLGITLSKQGALAEAIEHFEKSVTLEPTDARAYRNLGRAYHLDGRLLKGIEAYRTALERDPADAECLGSIAHLLYDSGDLAGAIATGRKALAMAPDRAVLRFNLALFLRKNGDFEEAQQVLRKGLDQCRGQKPWFRRMRDAYRRCAHLMQIARRLESFLQGQGFGENARECEDVATVLECRRRFAAGARFLAGAIQQFPELERDSGGRFRLARARATALAGFGAGVDAADSDRDERSVWRARAAKLLDEIADSWTRTLAAGGADADAVRTRLARLKWDRTFLALKKPELLDACSPDERQAWVDLWKRLDALIQRGTTEAPTSSGR